MSSEANDTDHRAEFAKLLGELCEAFGVELHASGAEELALVDCAAKNVGIRYRVEHGHYSEGPVLVIEKAPGHRGEYVPGFFTGEGT